MSLRIFVLLHKNRKTPGVLTVYNGEVALAIVPCLGDAADSLSVAKGNPTGDPTKFLGDTPSGQYIAQKGVVVLGQHVEGIGTQWIPLDPVGGQAQVAENNGRSGLAIHGGRGNDRLKPTKGCIRVFDKDFPKIRNALGSAKQVPVEVVEEA